MTLRAYFHSNRIHCVAIQCRYNVANALAGRVVCRAAHMPIFGEREQKKRIRFFVDFRPEDLRFLSNHINNAGIQAKIAFVGIATTQIRILMNAPDAVPHRG